MAEARAADEVIEGPRRGRAGLLPKQIAFVRDHTSKIVVFQGGYRSGKTIGLCAKTIDLGRRNIGHRLLAMEPIYSMVRAVYVANMLERCALWGIRARWYVSDKLLVIGRRCPIEVLCRSADSPRMIEGLTVAGLIADEWELYDPEALKVGMARVSVGPAQQIVLGGTAEGFGPAWSLVLEKPKPGTNLIISRTSENITLKADYDKDMRERLDTNEAREKLDGERTAKGGNVYTAFNRERHCSTPCLQPGEGTIEIWADFNAGLMCWLLVRVDHERQLAHVFGEIIREDTHTGEQAEYAARAIIDAEEARTGERMSRDEVRRRRYRIICDASASAATAVVALSHVAILAQSGFYPVHTRKNPAVEDRVACVQQTLNQRRITFDPQRAPYAVKCISQQPKAPDGSPFKHKSAKLGLDHGSDCVGYGCFFHWPAWRPAPNLIDERRARREDISRVHGR